MIKKIMAALRARIGIVRPGDGASTRRPATLGRKGYRPLPGLDKQLIDTYG